MANEVLKRDENHITVLGGVTDDANQFVTMLRLDPNSKRLLVSATGLPGGGTVTSVSVVTANGFAGSVATATTTPAITLTTTITGILSGNGTAISAASTTGSGAVVLATSPTLVTPVIGVATGTSLSVSGLLASATGLTLEETGAGTDIITIQAPASIAASYTLTLPVDDGNSGEVLSTNGSGVLSWISPGGTPTVITVANEATDTTCFPAFFTAATGDLGPKTNANLTFNSNTGALGATNFVGTFAGNTFTTGTGILTIAASKTLTVSNSITLAGTDSTVMTFPTTSATIARTDAANTFTGASTASAWVLTSPTITTKISPTSDDGAPLGDTTHNFSDLFLASGAVINYANSNVVITHTSGILTMGTGTLKITTPTNTSTSVVTVDGTQTFTNKRRTRRLTTTNAPGATPTTNTDNVDIMNFTGLATAITSMTTNLSGTPVDGDLLEFRFTDNGTARGITWGASFTATTVALPTTTVISTMLRVGFEWNGSTWACIATC